MDADFIDEHAAQFVNVVFATAPIYADARSQRLVKAFLQEAIAASDVFLRSFAAALIKFDPSKRSKQVCSIVRSPDWGSVCSVAGANSWLVAETKLTDIFIGHVA